MNNWYRKLTLILIGAGMLLGLPGHIMAQDGDYVVHTFEKIQLSSAFYAEGAAIGDINGDGQPDVIAGPFWYEGPDFTNKQAFYEPQEYDPHKYSENFIVEVDDVNDDGHNDILVVGFPGEAAHWYENPQNRNDHWERHLIHPRVDNESPTFHDLDRDGDPELLFHTDGYLGYADRKSDAPTNPWSFNRISGQRDWGRFNHGFGLGDIDGDGNEDVLMKDGWWKNPGIDQLDSQWEYHQADFAGPGGAQMYAYDVDGDGLNDVITVLDAHGWGMAWYRQVRSDGEIQFEQNLIMGDSEKDNRYGVKFAEPHALDLVDMDGDGVRDLVTGKRFWAHGPQGPYFQSNAAVLYWFKLDRDAGPDGEPAFIPYLVDYNSGVGVEVATGDLTGNGYPDIVTCNKKGTFLFLNRPQSVTREVWDFNRPDTVNESK